MRKNGQEEVVGGGGERGEEELGKGEVQGVG